MAIIALDIALLVGAAFDAVGCEYFLGGSVASSLQGEPRATNDIDFIVAMPRFRVRAFAEKLGSDFDVDQDMLREALGASKPRPPREPQLRADVVLAAHLEARSRL